MRLVHDWKRVLKHAWSIRLMVLMALLSGLEVALPYLEMLPIPPGVFPIVGLVVSIALPIVRLVAQKPLQGEDE